MDIILGATVEIVAVLVLLEGRMQHISKFIISKHIARLQSLFCWKVVCNNAGTETPMLSACFVAVLVLLEGRMQLF